MTDPRRPSAADVSIRALETAGLDPQDHELIRVGTNAVFSTPEVVVRVADQDYDTTFLRQQLDLSRWLLERGFPTARLVAFETVDGHPVTIWERIQHRRAATLEDLGHVALAFHELTLEYSGTLPEWDPLGRLGQRLDRMQPDQAVSAEALAALRAVKNDLVQRANGMEFLLPNGPIHGDLHAGNLVVDDDGPHLVDFDRIARGPREWDLVEPLADVRLFAGPASSWQLFVDAYGYDVTRWSRCDELLRLRGLFMLSWLLTLERTPRITEEIGTRLDYFLAEGAPHRAWAAV